MNKDLIKNNANAFWSAVMAIVAISILTMAILFLPSCAAIKKAHDNTYLIYHGSIGDDAGDCTVEHCNKHDRWFTRCTFDFDRITQGRADSLLSCGEWDVVVYNQCKCK